MMTELTGARALAASVMLVFCAVRAADYDPDEVRSRTLVNQWSWAFDVETGRTELFPHARSPRPGEPESAYDRYSYDAMLAVRDLAKAEKRFRRTLEWIDHELRERLEQAGEFDPDGGEFPTNAGAAPHVETLLNRRRGIGPCKKKSAMDWMSEVVPLPPPDLPAIRRPFYERAADLGFASVRGIELIPNVPFEYCSDNRLKVTKRYPEAAEAHRRLYEEDGSYRARFDSVVRQFTAEHEPDRVPPQDVYRLKLLTLELQVLLVRAGIAEDIELAMKRRVR
jgi:hypothetical protein